MKKENKEILITTIIYLVSLFAGMFAALIIGSLIFSSFFHTKGIPSSVASLTIFPVWFLITAIFLKRKKWFFKDIGLKGPVSLATAKFVEGGIMAAIFLIALFYTLFALKIFAITNVKITFLISLLLLFSFGYTIIQAGMEEIVFRGFLLKVFLARSKVFAVIISSLLFSVLHILQGLNALGLINIFLFGVFAALLYLQTKNLWLPIGFHVLWNFLQINVFSFPIYGQFDKIRLLILTKPIKPLISGGMYGPEASFITTAILIAATLLVFRKAKSIAI